MSLRCSMDITINGAIEPWIKGTSSDPTPSNGIPKFWTMCPFCNVRYRLYRGFLQKPTRCRSCNREFTAHELPLQGLSPGKNSSQDISYKRTLNQMLREIHQNHPVASNFHSSFWTMCRNCDYRCHFLKVYIDKWFVCPSCEEENIAMEVLSKSGEVWFNKWFQEVKSLSKNEATPVSGNKISPGLSSAVKVGEKRKRKEFPAFFNTQNHSKSEGVIDVDNNRRGFNDNGDEGWLEESDTLGSSWNVKVDKNSGLPDSSSGGDVQPKIVECADLKFNDFDKLREEVNFAVGQIWALYDTTSGVPRQYALIRKVSVPSFELRITYLEPDPDDEKEIQWFEEDLPVSAGKFRLGESQNTKDRSIFSHVIHCNEGSSTGNLIVSPRKGETWALFKNWDIKWSSEPDSHRKYEYEIVEILSDYTDGAGVSVAFLHKAKGFASVFFRMGTDHADISQILPHSLYRFSHRIPSFKMTGFETKDLPKDAYELDQAALPETIEEICVPSYLLAKLTAPKPKPEALCFARDGRVFQTGQIWSYYGYYDNIPREYCRIQKISLTQEFEQAPVFKINACQLKATPFPENVIQWEDKKMHVGCGTFSVTKVYVGLTPANFADLIVPQISMDGNEYTILPKIGEVWAIYRSWTPHLTVDKLEENYVDYVIVEVLDDALGYKVLALEPALSYNEEEENKTVLRAAKSRPSGFDDEDGLEVIFTIPKSKMLRFSHQISASRVTKEIDGEMKKVFEVDSRALPGFKTIEQRKSKG